MGFENKETLLDHIHKEANKNGVDNQVEGSYLGDENLKNLINYSWDLLDSQVKQEYLDAQNPKKLEEFIESMKRLRNSFPNKDLEDAKANFEFVDRSKYTLEEESVFKDVANSLSAQPSLREFSTLPIGVEVQLSTFTAKNVTKEDREKMNNAFANIMVGIVTNKNSFTRSRSIDELKISRQGQIHPDLSVAVAKFVYENKDKLPTDDKSLKKLGASFKQELDGLNLIVGPKNQEHFLEKLINKFNNNFKTAQNNRISPLSIDTAMRSDSNAPILDTDRTIYSEKTPANKENGTKGRFF